MSVFSDMKSHQRKEAERVREQIRQGYEEGKRMAQEQIAISDAEERKEKWQIFFTLLASVALVCAVVVFGKWCGR